MGVCGAVASQLLTQPVLENAVKAFGFGLIAVNGVWDFLRRVAVEVVCLALCCWC